MSETSYSVLHEANQVSFLVCDYSAYGISLQEFGRDRRYFFYGAVIDVECAKPVVLGNKKMMVCL